MQMNNVTKVVYSPNMKTVVVYMGEAIRVLSTRGLRKYAEKHDYKLQTYKDLFKILLEHEMLPKYAEHVSAEPEQMGLTL